MKVHHRTTERWVPNGLMRAGRIGLVVRLYANLCILLCPAK